MKTKKKKVFTRIGTLFSSIHLRSDANQSQIIGGDADEDHTQIVVGIQSNYWGVISPPCFGTTTLDALQHVIFGLLCLFRKSFHLNRLMLAHFYVNILKHSETIFTISEECE